MSHQIRAEVDTPILRRPTVRAILLVGSLLAARQIACSGEDVPLFPERPEYCAVLTSDDTFVIKTTAAHEEGEDDATPASVGFIQHGIVDNKDDGELKDLVSCYFEDEEAGLASAFASGRTNSKEQFNLVLTTPAKVNKDLGQSALNTMGLNKKLFQRIDGQEAIAFQPAITLPEKSRLHIVELGSNLTAISRKYGVSISEIMLLNSQTITDTIYPGQMLIIPAQEAVEKPQPLNPAERRKQAAALFIDQFGEDFKEGLDGELPLDAVLSQAMLESGFGLSDLAVNANNLFGIKAGNGWEGETHPKLTQEVYTRKKADECLASDPTCRILETLPDGRIRVERTALFRKYDSVKDCLKDYIAKIKDMYPDVATATNENYATALVDDKGKYKWATETGTRYIDSINSLRLLIPEFVANIGEKPAYDPANKSRLETASPDKVKLSQEFIDTLNTVELSVEGYNNAIATMFDGSELVREYPVFDAGRDTSDAAEFITNHFTAVMFSDKGDVDFARHVMGSMSSGKVGVQFVIRQSDGKIFRLTDADMTTRPGHNPPYSPISIGIEVESMTQGEITKTQIENLIYLNWYIAKHLGLSEYNLDAVMYGHGEQRNIDKFLNPTDGSKPKSPRSDFPTREMVALRDVTKRAVAAGFLPL